MYNLDRLLKAEAKSLQDLAIDDPEKREEICRKYIKFYDCVYDCEQKKTNKRLTLSPSKTQMKLWVHRETYVVVQSTILLIKTRSHSASEKSLTTLLHTNVTRKPFISCAADAIYAKWKTSETFSGGHVNVRYAPNRYCFQVLVTNNQIELLVPHLDCRLSRLRTADPPGILIETTVLISFHGLFVTGGDRLFVLRCFHIRHQGNLSVEGIPHNLSHRNSLIVLPSDNSSQITIKEVPKKRLECYYTVKQELVRDKSISSEVKLSDEEWASRQKRQVQEGKWQPVNERVAIGTPLLHEWSCRNAEPNQCLMVTNCIMKTQEDEHKLVDEQGCSMLPSLIPELQYEANHTVSQIVPLFSIVDQPFLYFQCQLNLVDVVKGGEGALLSCMPPKCLTTSQSSEMIFELNHRRKRRQISAISSQNLVTRTLDVISQRLEILPFGEHAPPKKIDSNCNEEKEPAHSRLERHEKNEKICMPKILIGIMTGLFIGVIIFAFACVLRSFLPRLKFSHVSTEQTQNY
uniref:ZP domain-containing protein n=1 Tax=Ditylenchus dipsaci TaxID=166011 RepID=A0A915EIS3_9BILA